MDDRPIFTVHLAGTTLATTVRAMSLPSALNRDRAPSLPSDLDALRSRIESIAQKSNARAVAVALHDTETGVELRYEADRWFHGASTIKVAILLAVYGEIDSGRLVPQSRLHVRNRFLSAYLAHLDDEERTLFASLSERIPPVAFLAQSAQQRGAQGEEFLLKLWAVTTCEERAAIEMAQCAEKLEEASAA